MRQRRPGRLGHSLVRSCMTHDTCTQAPAVAPAPQLQAERSRQEAGQTPPSAAPCTSPWGLERSSRSVRRPGGHWACPPPPARSAPQPQASTRDGGGGSSVQEQLLRGRGTCWHVSACVAAHATKGPLAQWRDKGPFGAVSGARCRHRLLYLYLCTLPLYHTSVPYLCTISCVENTERQCVDAVPCARRALMCGARYRGRARITARPRP